MTSARSSYSTLLALFFLSGVSGLVYEVVWLRMLVRTFGITVFAVSTVLVAFMGGLALGSFLAARYLAGTKTPLRLYAIAEVVIGVSAILSTALMARLPELFRTVVLTFDNAPTAVVAFRTVAALVVLLPPTVAMGTTLPLLSGYLSGDRDVGRHAGLLYGVNTFGAVTGVVASGAVMIAVLGEQATVWVAAGLNLAVGVMAFVLAGRPTQARPPDADAPPAGESDAALARKILIVSAVSGFCALAYQVLWARMLNLLLGNSVYGFSAMLAVYLIGISVGSVVLSRIAQRLTRPIATLAGLQAAIAVLGVLSLQTFVALGVAANDPRYTYSQLWSMADFGRLIGYSVLIVLPLTLMLGAIFPITSRLTSTTDRSVQDSIGRLYTWNTVGAIAGSAVTGYFMIPVLGTLMSFLLTSVITLGLAIYLFQLSGKHESFTRHRVSSLLSGLALLLLMSFSLQDPFLSVLVARVDPTWKVIAHEEDRTATATLFTIPDSGQNYLFINGLYVSNTSAGLGAMMVGAPLAFHPDPKKTMIVGLGAGEAFRASLDLGFDTTVVDLVPNVVDFFRRFRADAARYLDDPKGHVVIDDGRNYLLATDQSFDLILVDGTPPVFASGMVNLYSLEFAQMARDHLTDDGIYALWFPLTCFEDDLWMVVRNFAETFEHMGMMMAPPGQSFVILLGSKKNAFEVEPAVVAERLRTRGVKNPDAIAQRFLGALPYTEADLRQISAAYPVVTDDLPYTEFPLAKFWSKEPYYRDNKFLYRPRAGD